MIIDNDFDRRQIELMKYNIANFENKKIDLCELVDRLDGLYREITKLDTRWQSEFFEKLVDLESLNASLLASVAGEMSVSEKVILQNSITAIKKLIELALDVYLNTSNSSILQTATIIDHLWLSCPECNNAWESTAETAMVICPACNTTSHNPRWNLGSRECN